MLHYNTVTGIESLRTTDILDILIGKEKNAHPLAILEQACVFESSSFSKV